MTGIVRAERVAFRYPQHDYGLRPTSLQIEVGESVFVSGPSGSGKSTLARCLVGLIPHLFFAPTHLTLHLWLLATALNQA